MFFISKHEFTPGLSASLPIAGAAPVRSFLASDMPTLCMFVHPRCPCSAASAEELARLMMRCQGRLKAVVLVFQPKDEPASWSQTSLWSSLRRIPGVCVRLDRDAVLARRFGAITSGQVMLFDRSCRLLFSGGITGSRGHAGDNDGVDSIIAIVLGTKEQAVVRSTPVFGCAVYSDSNARGADR